MPMPRYVVAQPSYGSGKYLHYIQDGGKFHGNIAFNGDSILSPYAKFEFERADTEDNCYHIRCCYNNKYWTRDSNEHGARIVAVGHVPKSKGWDSTLFKVRCFSSFTDNRRQIPIMNLHIWHMGNGDQVCTAAAAAATATTTASTTTLTALPPPGFLYGVRYCNTTDHDPIFRVMDWESLMVLPKHVAFKGVNGRYLQARMIDGHPYLEFSSHALHDYPSQHVVCPEPDGSIRIKSTQFDRFWTIGNWWNNPKECWVWADLHKNASTIGSNHLFWPIKLGGSPNRIALRNLGNGKILTTLQGGNTSCLNADSLTVQRNCTLVVEELVAKREIYNVNYRLSDARICSEQEVIGVGSQTVTNRSSVPTTCSLRFCFTKTSSEMWSYTVSLMLGGEIDIKAGIPFLAEGKIKVKAEVTGQKQWGGATENAEQAEEVVQVTALPNTKVIARMIATKGQCDVPYSYTQRDTLFDGQVVTSDMDDGLYSGTNTYNFHVETTNAPLN